MIHAKSNENLFLYLMGYETGYTCSISKKESIAKYYFENVNEVSNFLMAIANENQEEIAKNES